jgi:hypothetical protein
VGGIVGVTLAQIVGGEEAKDVETVVRHHHHHFSLGQADSPGPVQPRLVPTSACSSPIYKTERVSGPRPHIRRQRRGVHVQVEAILALCAEWLLPAHHAGLGSLEVLLELCGVVLGLASWVYHTVAPQN